MKSNRSELVASRNASATTANVSVEVVGGQSITGTVTLNNFSRNLAGSAVSLTSGDATVQVPATVTVPYRTTSATFTATPAAGSPWVGWSGGVVSNSQTITITMTKAISVTANFK